MEVNELKELLSQPTKLVTKIKALAPVLPDYVFDLEPEDQRVVKDINYRPWRDVDVATGVLDAQGNMTYRTEKRDVHRLPSSTRKQIIEWAVNMNLAGGIELKGAIREALKVSDETMLAMLEKTWEDCKLDYVAQEIDRLKKSYTQCLVVWYSTEAEEGFWEGIAPDSVKFKMRCSVFSPEDGSLIIPVYNRYKEQITCARSYIVKVDDKDVNTLDVYLSDRTITLSESGSEWIAVEKPQSYGKATYVFHGQKRTEYADILPKDERVAEVDSDTADENQQSSFPILAAIGEIEATAGGGTKNTRKTFSMKDGGDLKYVEAKGSQQSAIEERKNLRQDIYDETATPQISFESIKGSSNIPGVTIEMMFLPATNKAKRNQKGDLGMEWQRHINLLKSCMAVINIAVAKSKSMSIKPVFKIELPRNLTEEYDRIISLVAAGLLSRAKAIEMLKLVDKPEDELKLINEELDAAQVRASKLIKPVTPPTT
jgi:hypothetical protein